MSRQKERGIVLVAVLFAVAIMSVLVVAAAALSRAGIASQGLEQRRLASQFALRSGLETAKALIMSTPAPLRVYFDGSPVTVDLGNGINADITVRDAAGLADLNATGLSILEGLLAGSLPAAEAAGLSTRLADWRSRAEDKANTQPAPVPAQQGAAGQSGEMPEAASSPLVFQSVSQFQALVNPDAAAPLSAHVTVFNPAGLLNPLAAADEVLLATPGFTSADLSAVKQARRVRAQPADQGLGSMLERLRVSLAIRDPAVFVIGIHLRAGPGIIARSRAEAVVKIAADGPLPFHTLAVSGL
jgi:general secretion pathway protein K